MQEVPADSNDIPKKVLDMKEELAALENELLEITLSR